MSEEKQKRGKDSTRTQRQGEYLERLAEGQGKRLVVDLDGAGKRDLGTLLEDGYAANQRGVVHRALKEAVGRSKKKKQA